jgi:tRNA A37 N6-isopentenylltransferase MiaA
VIRVQGSGFRVQDKQPLSGRANGPERTPEMPQAALSRTASQAVGYREVLEHLRGERDLPATIELVKLRTRQFAKRQLTWFRSLSECRWIAVGEPFDPAAVSINIAAMGAVAP